MGDVAPHKPFRILVKPVSASGRRTSLYEWAALQARGVTVHHKAMVRVRPDGSLYVLDLNASEHDVTMRMYPP
jgi:hypothetical protein